LFKDGEGDVILSGVNFYGGVTEIGEGAIVVRKAQALGDSSASANTIVNPGTALVLESDLALEPILLQGNGLQPPLNGHESGALRDRGPGNHTYTGVLTLGTDATIGVDSGSSLTIGGPGGGTITDGAATFNLTKESLGLLVLAGANTFSGKLTVNQGQ